MAESEDEDAGHDRLKLKDLLDEVDDEDNDAEDESDEIDTNHLPRLQLGVGRGPITLYKSASTKHVATNASRSMPC